VGVKGNSSGEKKWSADDADFTADKIRIGKDFGFNPDFIGVEVCAICGPFGGSARCYLGLNHAEK